MQHSDRTAAKKLPVVFKFPLYLRFGLTVLTALTITMSAARIATHHALLDPFALVSDLINGDVRSVLMARGFTCYAAQLPYNCLQDKSDPAQPRIYVRRAGNRVEEAGLALPEKSLTLGDLVAVWGIPEPHSYCDLQTVAWSMGQNVTATVVVTRTRPINYFAPVSYITFTRGNLPTLERDLAIAARHGC